MSAPSFSYASFIAAFPTFNNVALYSQAALANWWTMGTAYINIEQRADWQPAQVQLAADLMCAHLAASFALINADTPAGVITSASQGSVSVSMQPPPTASAFGYWLATTPYGTQLRALLGVVAGVGLYVGGSLERASFRKAGGRWG